MGYVGEEVQGKCCYCRLRCFPSDDYTWARDGEDVYHQSCLLAQGKEEWKSSGRPLVHSEEITKDQLVKLMEAGRVTTLCVHVPGLRGELPQMLEVSLRSFLSAYRGPCSNGRGMTCDVTLSFWGKSAYIRPTGEASGE